MPCRHLVRLFYTKNLIPIFLYGVFVSPREDWDEECLCDGNVAGWLYLPLNSFSFLYSLRVRRMKLPC